MSVLEARDGAWLLRVRVQPRASREDARMDAEGRLCIALTAPPVEGAANAAVCLFLARRLAIAKSCVSVAAGEKSREKTLRITRADENTVRRFLDSLPKKP